MQIQVDKANIELLGSQVAYFERPANPNTEAPSEQLGQVRKFRVTTLDTLNMVFGLVTWPEAQAEVRGLEFIDGLGKYERLLNAGKMMLLNGPSDTFVAELNVMKIGSKDRANLHGSTLDELSFLASTDFEKLAQKHGAIAVGTRSALDGTQNRNANRLAVKVKKDGFEAIAVAFTVTRVLAIMNDLGI